MTIPFELQMIHKQSGVQLFSYRFRDDISLEPTLISGFVSAVITFAEELKPSEGKEMVKYIDRGDFILQVEPGIQVIGLLILSSKDYSFKEKLKLLVVEFEQRYHSEITNFNGFQTCFIDFEEMVKQLISRRPISPYHIPRLTTSDRGPQKLDDIKWAILTRINGMNDINAISEELELSVEVVQSIIAYFEEIGIVKTQFTINDNTVFELTKKGLTAIEVGSDQYNETITYAGEYAVRLLGEIGSQRTLIDIKKKIAIEKDELNDLIEKLVSDRYLEILPQWKLVLDKKDFQYTRSLEFIDDLFQLIYDEADNWLGIRELERLKRDTFALTIIKDESLAKLISEQKDYLIDQNNLRKLLSQTSDFDIILDQLEKVFKILRQNIEREIGTNLTKDILKKVRRRLEDIYTELLEQQTELIKMLNWFS
ncbi:MAG: hypothetical protein JXA54_04500 [Candidatus Heimdallarchaeota archaeon]|nr:hypothetical protein [Candidatus Heimdallarchaeota archaeon]